MRPLNIALAMAVSIVLLLCNCQNGIDYESDFNRSGKVMLSFKVSPYQQISFENTSFTRTAEIDTLCKTIMLAVYDSDDKLDTLITQHAEDTEFGSLPVSLSPGKYRFAIIAHSSDKQPNVDNPKRIDFGASNMSDVLFWSDNIFVGEDTLIDVSLKRIVAKIEVTSTDSLAKNVNQVYLWFSGGSYIFNAVKGCADKSFNDYREINLSSSERGKPLSVSFYTFPTTVGDVLKELMCNVTRNGNIIDSKTINNVPIKANYVTRLTGKIHTK